MNKAELINAIVEKSELSKKDADAALTAVLEAIKEALGMMSVIGFGSVALYIFGVFAAIGALSGIVGSAIMISKYLKKEGSEFTAI